MITDNEALITNELKLSGLFFQPGSAAGAGGAFQGETCGRVTDPFISAERSSSDDAFSHGCQFVIGLWLIYQCPPVSW